MDIERWQKLLADYRANTARVAWEAERDERRRKVQNEMLALLEGFETGSTSVDAFKETFDRKTRTDWDVFGLKGMSGAMFLNQLVKHAPNKSVLTERLKTVLRAPSTVEAGRQQMEAFCGYLESLIVAGQVTRKQFSPLRTPFFLSAWWHLQQPSLWPIFYISGRRILEREKLYVARQEPVDDYLAFRRVFSSLQEGLGTEAWELEHLLGWLDENPISPPPPVITTTSGTQKTDQGQTTPTPGTGTEDGGGTGHTHVQYLLAQIGQKVGCKVWVAANDRGKAWHGKYLAELSLKELPALGLDAESYNLIKLIDVLWIKHPNKVVAAFEIEHTTSIYSGLLRMSDLVALSPNLNFPLYIVAPKERLDQVRRELSRPTFQSLELNRRCGFFASEALIDEADQILKWAGDPTAIERLVSRVPDQTS
ncbi:MAG: hypothetical protein U0822_11355 [Anaerolineae bacterium]